MKGMTLSQGEKLSRTWPIDRIITGLFAVFLLIFSIPAFSQDLSNVGEEKAIRLDGSISLSGNKYSVQGAPARRPSTGWTIIGTPTLSIYNLSLPFTIILSD